MRYTGEAYRLTANSSPCNGSPSSPIGLPCWGLCLRPAEKRTQHWCLCVIPIRSTLQVRFQDLSSSASRDDGGERCTETRQVTSSCRCPWDESRVWASMLPNTSLDTRKDRLTPRKVFQYEGNQPSEVWNDSPTNQINRSSWAVCIWIITGNNIEIYAGEESTHSIENRSVRISYRFPGSIPIS